MSIIVYNTSKTKITLEDKPLATPGGEGAVHRVVGSANYVGFCVKIYHLDKRTPKKKHKIDFMIRNKPSGLMSSNFIICWPCEIIFDHAGNFIGFLMPLAFAGSIPLYELVTAKINIKLIPQWVKFDRTSKAGIERRLKVCVNISIALHSIHAPGKYAMIDYKPQNILITNDGKISVTDVDSFQISENGKVLYHGEVTTQEYAPPEGIKLKPSISFIPEYWDRFSFAVSFYELLFGIHPYAATSNGQYINATSLGEKIEKGLFVHGSKKHYLAVVPNVHTNFYNLPISIKNLFLKAFEEGHTNPSIRPQAQVWGQTIVSELNIDTSIKPNIAVISKMPVPAFAKQPVYKIDPVPVHSTNKTIPKKNDYMIWKILTGILFLLVIIFIGIGQSKKSEIETLKEKVSNYEAKSDNLQTKLSQIQNQQAANDATYIARITELEASLRDIGEKYPISIVGISFNNVNSNSEILKSESQYFTKREVQYLQPVIKYNSNLLTSANVEIYYKIFNPNGELISGLLSPSGYTWYGTCFLTGNFSKDNTVLIRASGINSDCSVYCITGRHTVEIWCNGIRIGESYFTINEY